MKARHWKKSIAALVLSVPVCGCSSGVPFGWGSSGSPFSSTPKTAANSVTSSVASTWSSLKSGITAPFAKSTDGNDPTSLASGIPKVGPEVYTSTSALYEAQGNVQGALEQYRKALQVAPNDTNVLLGYARLIDRTGNPDEAIKAFTDVTRREPNNPKAFNDLGLCQAKNGQVDAAIQNLQKATELKPDEQLYRNNLAKVLVQANRTGEAYQQLAAAFPPAQAHYNLGFLLAEKGDAQGAQHELGQALQIDPNLAPARQKLASLQGQADALRGQVNQYTQAGQQVIGQFTGAAAPQGGQPTWPATQPLAPQR